jgi:hypothetical protein
MATEWSYVLNVREMVNEKEIYVKKRDEALQKWKEYIISYDGGDYSNKLEWQYQHYKRALGILEGGIEYGRKIEKTIKFR